MFNITMIGPLLTDPIGPSRSALGWTIDRVSLRTRVAEVGHGTGGVRWRQTVCGDVTTLSALTVWKIWRPGA